MKQFFKSKEIFPGVYGITSEAVAKFLIVGEHHALLFDTGYGFGNLAEYVRTIIDLPLYVVNSHGHIDHAGGNTKFDNPCYMHHDDLEVYKYHQSEDFRKIGWEMLYSVQRILFFYRFIIPKGYKMSDYLSNPVSESFIDISEGQEFDLGGVTLRVVEIPGHTAGSIGLYCPEKKLFFASDGICGGTWLFLPESTKLSVYLNSLKKVETLDFDYLITGHSIKPEPKAAIYDYIDVAENIDFEGGIIQKESAFTPGVIYKQCFSKTKPKGKKSAFVMISEDKIF